ncbi:MAG TPA: glycosyltransferase [Thermoanaerobaculia bacterium]|jgi:glycosyltransferase involved in cell wall biosynthesis|nr:glycosyltransferase [Thermoanaerobaculia bacterium]
MGVSRTERSADGLAARAARGGEHLVFFGIRPWNDLARFGYFRAAGGTFGCLLGSGRFAPVTYVHAGRRWGFRVDVEEIGEKAQALGLPAGLPLGRFAVVRRFNRWLQSRLLSRALARRDGSDRLYWLYDWEQIGVAGQLGPGRCLVECQDDPAQVLAGFPSRLDEIPANRSAALARADLVVAVEASLLDGIRDGSSRFAVVPNGVSVEFLEAASRPSPEPEELKAHPHPRLVVVAGEWSFEKRVDHELLEAVLDRLGGWSLVLVGVPERPGRSLARLVHRPDVVALGSRPYLDLVPVLRACDVGAVPYREAGGRDVLKTYEYLACGLPVAATFDAPRPALAPWVVRAAGPDAFAAACASLAHLAPVGSPELRAALEERTWERRTDSILALLDAVRPRASSRDAEAMRG